MIKIALMKIPVPFPFGALAMIVPLLLIAAEPLAPITLDVAPTDMPVARPKPVLARCPKPVAEMVPLFVMPPLTTL
ncbi:MAG: hypothetical protein JO105_20020 [Hyphomicrobiales bacterium]|nr:hypothetical protein [Hyphomicrobiales bacterium]